MQIIVCKRGHLLHSSGNDAAQPKLTTGAATPGALVQKAVRVMKLTAFFILATCLHVNATDGYGQKVTLSEREVHVEKIFNEIKKQTGFNFLYTSNILANTHRVTVNVTNALVTEVLDMVVAGQGLEYRVKGEDKLIIVKNKPVVRSVAEGAKEGGPIDVSGKVTDAEGRALPGANVKVRGSNIGVTTDKDGRFSLKDIPENSILEISYVGHEVKTFTVRGSGLVNIALDQKLSMLDEAVVIAYGQTTKRLATGNVSSVKAIDIAKQPVNNPLLALQGRVPGLFIEQANGVPGSGVTVKIQGISSLGRGSDPLYVIDGVPYVSQMLLGIGAIQGRSGSNGTGNPMSYINPADIESIEVLKDADATSIYGSRAAAGAILITTKKGKSGKTSVDLNFQQGWGEVGHFLDLLNTDQYLEMRMEAKVNDNVTINSTDYDLNGTWDKNRYTDWQKELIGGTSRFTDAQLSISGGSGTTSYLVSGGYHRETLVFPGDQHDVKASTHINLNHASPNQRFHFQIDGKYLIDNNRLFNTDLTNTAILLAPNAPALYDANGNLNWETNSSNVSTWANPLAFLLNTYKGQVNNLLGNAVISYQVLPKFEIKTNLGYNYLKRDEVNLTPLTYRAPETRATSLRYSSFGNDLITSWIIEPQASYKTNISNGTLEALVGTTFQKNKAKQQQLDATGFTSDLLMEDIRSAATITPGLTEASEYRYNALFGRLNYNWQNKYIINLAARRDGSSRFGSNNLFNNFGSIAGAWIFSNEKFIRNGLSVLSFGKLRASYGTTGSDQIGDYQFLSVYFSRSRTVPYQGAAGLYTTGFPNPYLEWEETRKLQAALEVGFLSDRILISATHFHNRSSNQLLSYALPLSTGNPNIFVNLPATIQNSGWELSLNTTNIQNREFNWSSSFNLTIPKNKLVAFDELSKSSLATNLVIGKPFTIIQLYHSLGVDPATGLFSFSDSNGNQTSNPVFPTDANVLVNTAPQFYGGIQNTFKYKGFAVDFLFQFVKQIGRDYSLGNQPGVFLSTNSGIFRGNQPVSVLSRWQKPGDNASFQRFSSTYSSLIRTPYSRAGQSDMVYVDASYIRLKNLSFSWQVPEKWRKIAHLQNARFYAQGQNLWTITNYTGLDPETRNINSLPPLRVWTLGIQVTL